MRRTITTLMILAVSGLAYAARAADNGGKANWQYYAAGTNSYRVSDDDDAPPSGGQSGVANAGGTAQQTGQEQNALYLAEQGANNGVLQTSFFEHDGNCCDNCDCNCLSNCCNCDCSTTMFRVEWLGWFTRGRNAPPLVTTAPVGTTFANAGRLDRSETAILYGSDLFRPDPIGTSLRNGARLTASRLLGDGLTTATARFWGIEDGSATFAARTDTGILAIPYHNALFNVEAAQVIAFPGVAAPGSIRVLSKNDLIGADAWASRNWYNDGSLSVDVLGGYQFTRLDDSLTISTLSTALAPQSGFNPGDNFAFFDTFRTKNEFHGGTAGLLARVNRNGAFTLEGLFKMGLGNMRQTVFVNGNTSVFPGGVAPPVVAPGGIFTQPSNIGTQVHNHFEFVPEVNTNLLYNINSNWRAMVGYTFIYYNNVVLAGNQIDRNVNLGQGIGGPQLPAPKFQRTDFWVQGISLGADYRW